MIFNGIEFKEMKLIVEEPEALLTRASKRIETIQIDGRDGADYNDLGYSSVDITLKSALTDLTLLDDVKQWLLGPGILEYKDRVTDVLFYEEINAVRTAGIRLIDIHLKRSPFWYKANDNYQEVSFVSNKANVNNEGTVFSKPYIKLIKSTGTKCHVKINDVYFKYDFNNDTYVEIDCLEMDAYFNGLRRNKQLEIGYKFPILLPGINTVEIIEGDCKIEIKRKDCWL